MKPEERRERMALLVKEATRISVDELAALLETSRETVRRDLTLLSEQGLLRKVHGGAVYTQTAQESPLGDRRAAARAEKIAIGRTAAGLFRQGDSLLIDAGSTTAYFAEALKNSGSFTVITNSTVVAAEMWSSPSPSEVYLLGGRYFGGGHEVLGSLVVDQIQRLHTDHAVLTVGAVDQGGTFMDFNADEAFIARAMIASARRVTVLADSSKLGRHALFQVCKADRVHRLVTERAPDDAVENALRAAGVEIIIADPAQSTIR
ncbi:DeoR/GlpR family DNA-binding transcription regulator [Mesorhizobium sp. LHD-90]|uniref:DeoR/GlpR family DNA-binding transcription regulator n=1 Tax=Mesorhizobium sp. LHD-90 TaxID=3071414 RepID=UPI0027E0015C|nr:DeoR/GlpR family DNA-binding transcription regulator [Mesorhizobium sp. LHD-90]MDQ6435334.1 DeoR/GlpR family DNA-binding transcription regulator [Mesorhizobium sp. LHD-90]